MHPGTSALPRHRHGEAYAALVLSGGFVEAGMGRRVRAQAGDVILHPAYAAHRDWFGREGAEVLNLPLVAASGEQFGKVRDPDRIVRLSETDPPAALAELLAQWESVGQSILDWPDRLADELLRNDALSLRDWSDANGLNPASVSRGFRKVFGTSPVRFRLEAKLSRAAEQLRSTRNDAAQIAVDCGFADQAHMCRTFRASVGCTPSEARQIPFKR